MPTPDRSNQRLFQPPLKIQGGKARLAPWLATNTGWMPTQRWVEPFLGAGGVLFNLLPERALVADTNPHIVGLYRGLQDGSLPAMDLVEHLAREGDTLRRVGAPHYYAVRERFNHSPTAGDFLWLNHAGFNGLLRFNRSGGFNTPFCKDVRRFTPSLLRSLTSRLMAVQEMTRAHAWQFELQAWPRTLSRCDTQDFVYLDPPYCGRHTTYHGAWNESDATELATALRALDCTWALSDWARDRNRVNPRLAALYRDRRIVQRDHRYVIGARGDSRQAVVEALVLSRSDSSD